MATSKAVLCLWVAALFISTGVVSISSGRNVSDIHHKRAARFTIEELLHTKFPSRISDDIDLDPCKGGKNPTILKIKLVYILESLVLQLVSGENRLEASGAAAPAGRLKGREKEKYIFRVKENGLFALNRFQLTREHKRYK
jgi:hypothetical protein